MPRPNASQLYNVFVKKTEFHRVTLCVALQIMADVITVDNAITRGEKARFC